MSFYVNGCQCVYNVYLVYVPCPIRDPHHTGIPTTGRFEAVNSGARHRYEASRKVNGRCWNYAPSVCSKYGQRYANVPAYREQRLLVLKKKR